MFYKLYTNIKRFIKENYQYLIIIFIIFLINNIRLPWSIYIPGGTINIVDRLENTEYETSGTINMTYVSFKNGNIPSLLLALINPNWDIVSNSTIIYDNETMEDDEKRSEILLYSSISNAKKIAYEKAGKELDVLNKSYYVIYVLQDSFNSLKVGDQLLEYNGIVIEDIDGFTNYISSLKENDPVILKIKRNNKEKIIESKVFEYKDGSIKLGVSLAEVNTYKDGIIKYNYKSNEFGSSGGLMLTLAVYNSLTNKDLTNGRNVCGTGTIELDGSVGEIGGVKYKLAGAVKNECDIFLVPTDNYKEALEVKEKNNFKIDIIEVKTFDQVLEVLNK